MKNYISDMLTRIQNGHNANLKQVILHNNIPKKCIQILNILEKEGYILGWEEWYFVKNKLTINNKTSKISQIKVFLKRDGQGRKAIRALFLVSKPGRKVFLSTKALWKPKSSIGLFILSTPFGFLTDKEARYYNVGGEVICGIC